MRKPNCSLFRSTSDSEIGTPVKSRRGCISDSELSSPVKWLVHGQTNWVLRLA